MKNWKITTVGAIALIIAVGVIGLAVYSGVYNVAADDPHSRAIYWLTSTVRARSIATRARDITVPFDLGDPKHIAAGAAEYDEMCSGCHLAPGQEKTRTWSRKRFKSRRAILGIEARNKNDGHAGLGFYT
jgi:hypothetical protein